MMRGAFARFLPVVIACLAGVGRLKPSRRYCGSRIFRGLADYGEGRRGSKDQGLKCEGARKTAHDGLFLPPDALLQLICLKNKPLIHVMFAFQIGSKADSEIRYRFDEKPMQPVEARLCVGSRSS